MRKIQLYLFFISILLFVSFFQQNTLAAKATQTNIYGSVIKLDAVDLGDQSYQLLITTEGYYLINSTEIVSFYKTTDQFRKYVVSPDINDDGINEIIFITDSNLSSNLKVIDIYNSEILWDYSPIRIGKDMLGQHVEMQAPIIDCEVTNDSLYIVYDYNIEKLNLTTGDSIWTHKENDNIWSISSIKDVNNDGLSDIVYSVQPAYVKAISSYDHKVIWENKLTSDYDIVEQDNIKATVETNVWQVESDSLSNIYAAGEDGYIYKLDSNGKLINEIELLEIPKGYYNNYYNQKSPKPTGLNNGTYENVRFNLVENNNTTFVQYYLNYPLNMKSNNNNNGPSPSFGIVDFDTETKKLWGEDIQNNNSHLKYVLENENNYYLMVEKVSSGIHINYYDINTNLLEADKTIDIPINNINMFNNTQIYFSVSGENIYFISNNSDLHIYNLNTKEIKYISRIQEQQIKPLDENINLSFDIRSSKIEYNRPTEYTYSGLKGINTETNEIIWNFNISDSNYDILGGFKTYHIIQDINNDSTKDILIFFSRISHDQNVDVSNTSVPNIITISGKDGSIIYEDTIELPSEITSNNDEKSLRNTLSSPIRNSFQYADINNDGTDEYLFMNSHFDIFIIDIKTGKLERFLSGNVYEYNLQGDEYLFQIDNPGMGEPTPYILPDNNSDGYPELLLVDWGKVSVLSSNISDDRLYFSESQIILSNEYISSNNVEIHSFIKTYDLNGDGIKDFTFYESDGTTNKEGYSNYKLTVYSGSDASKLYSLPTNQAIIYPSNYDINNNGTKDFFTYSGWNNESNSRGYFLFDGQTGEILFSEYNNHWNDYIDPLINKQALQPFTVSSDLTGDGNPDIIGIKNLAWDAGVVVQIYDLNSEVINQIIFDKARYENDEFLEWSYGQHISYHEIDGTKYLLFTALYKNERDIQTVFYNLSNNTREFVIQDIITNLIDVNKDYVEYINLNGKQKKLSLLSNLEFTNINDGDTIDKQSTIKWNSSLDNVLYTLYVDNTKVSTTYDKEFPVILESGEHSISISQLDSNGMILFTTINVNVVNDNTSIYYLSGFIILGAILVFITPIKWRNYNKAVINNE